MNVTIEHVFCRYCDEAEDIYFRIMNTILFFQLMKLNFVKEWNA